MILDANLLLYAVDRTSPFHQRAREWLTATLDGPLRVGIPWQTLGAFLRIATNPRVFAQPLETERAWRMVRSWLAVEVVWIPEPGPRYAETLGELLTRHNVRGNLVPDAELAALALDHGLTVYSADTDFARFREVRWLNPCAAS